MRELTGGIYFGVHERTENVEGAGMNGALHHLAQAHAHKPGRLKRHPAQLGARSEGGAGEHVGHVVRPDLGR